MKQPELNLLFSEPVLKIEIHKGPTDSELKVFNDELKLLQKNVGNHSSSNNYILDHKKLSKFKKIIQGYLEYYVTKVLFLTDKTKPYITQSWLNLSHEEEYHHVHRHPNSFVSGVFYLEANEEYDSISFYKNLSYSMIEAEISKFETWNSQRFDICVKKGDIILFPSSLEHSVRRKKDKNPRVSLAFNCFLKGVLGGGKELTELKL